MISGCHVVSKYICMYRINRHNQWIFDTPVLHLGGATGVKLGYAVAKLVEAPRYRPEGRGFDSRWCHLNFSLT
jgi:hypothetical protein